MKVVGDGQGVRYECLDLLAPVNPLMINHTGVALSADNN